MILNDLTDGVYVINRDKDTKQYLAFMQEIIGKCSITRIPGVEAHRAICDEPAKLGNRLAHLLALQTAYDNNLDTVLVLEDDIIFDPKINISAHLPKWKEFLDSTDWAVFYLGGAHRPGSTTRVAENIVRTTGTIATHAVIYNLKYYKELYDLFDTPGPNHPYPVDYFLAGGPGKEDGFCHKYPCFSAYPRFILQRDSTNTQGDFYPSSHWKENYAHGN